MAKGICPHCNAEVKDLALHIKRQHPGQTDDADAGGNQNLELDTGRDDETAQGYHCVDCGGSITHRQEQCPGCGTELDWSDYPGGVI